MNNKNENCSFIGKVAHWRQRLTFRTSVAGFRKKNYKGLLYFEDIYLICRYNEYNYVNIDEIFLDIEKVLLI